MYRLKIAGMDQVSFGPVPVLMIVKIIWSSALHCQYHYLGRGGSRDININIHFCGGGGGGGLGRWGRGRDININIHICGFLLTIL